MESRKEVSRQEKDAAWDLLFKTKSQKARVRVRVRVSMGSTLQNKISKSERERERESCLNLIQFNPNIAQRPDPNPNPNPNPNHDRKELHYAKIRLRKMPPGESKRVAEKKLVAADAEWKKRETPEEH